MVQALPNDVNDGSQTDLCAGLRSIARLGSGRGLLTEFQVAVGVGGGCDWRIGIKGSPIEKVSGTKVEAAPHHECRAFPGVVAGPEFGSGVGLAVLVARLMVRR